MKVAAVSAAGAAVALALAPAAFATATGLVGGAVEFTRAPSSGTVANSKNDNPGTQNFAMGLVFTTRPIRARTTAAT
jgi:hypothetical protein